MGDTEPKLEQDAAAFWKTRFDTLLALAREVRRAQQRYFRSRTKEDLIEAKQLESKLDGELFS